MVNTDQEFQRKIIRAMNAVSCSETPANSFQTTGNNIPDDVQLYTCCCNNLKSSILQYFNFLFLIVYAHVHFMILDVYEYMSHILVVSEVLLNLIMSSRSQ